MRWQVARSRTGCPAGRQPRPGRKLYLILDNFSPHKHPEVTSWAAAHDVELVFLPTYSSWLNWIPVNRPSARRHARAV